MKKAEVEQVLEENISQREWHTAKKHACYPGPMEPVEAVKFNRTRYKLNDLEAFLSNVDATYAQHHAYGMTN